MADESTQEDHLSRQEQAFDAMAEFFQDYMDKNDGHIYLYEFGMFLYVLLMKMRQTMKTPELANYLMAVLFTVEKAIATSKEEGEDLLVAEDWRDMEGGEEMIQALFESGKEEEELVLPDWMTEEK